MVRKTDQQLAARVFIEQRADEFIDSITNVDHQLFHLVVIEAR
jgi:hypothetical protein